MRRLLLIVLILVCTAVAGTYVKSSLSVNGDINILGTGNGINFSDGTKQDTASKPSAAVVQGDCRLTGPFNSTSFPLSFWVRDYVSGCLIAGGDAPIGNVLPTDGVLKNFTFVVTANGYPYPATQEGTVTLFINGQPTAISCQVTVRKYAFLPEGFPALAEAYCRDSANTVQVVAGDEYAVRYTISSSNQYQYADFFARYAFEKQ